MNSFAQRIDERSAINPSGFTGVIIQNSNVVIDKTFIEKGTSFVNAYENSNVVLKDCGSPNPTLSDQTDLARKLKSNLKLEVDKSTLPPWIYYKLAKTSNYNILPTTFNDDNTRTRKTIDLELINQYDIDKLPQDQYKIISTYRDELIGSVFPKNNDNRSYNNESQSIESRILTEGKISSKDVDFTVSGMYWLDGVESAIKAVWPLDKTAKYDQSNPKLNLRFKERMLFPLKLTSQSEPIYMANTYKLDELGEKIVDDEVNIPQYEFAPNTHKHVVESSMNTVSPTSSLVEFNGIFKLNHYNDKMYFDGPYYSSKVVAYYINDKYNGQILQNDDKVLNFYFRLNDETYSLFDVINYSPSTNPELTNVITTLNEHYHYQLSQTDTELYMDLLTVPDEWDRQHLGTTTTVVGLRHDKNNNDETIAIGYLDGESTEYKDAGEILLNGNSVNLLKTSPFYRRASDNNDNVRISKPYQNGFFMKNGDGEISSFFTATNRISYQMNFNNGDSVVSAKIKTLSNGFNFQKDYSFNVSQIDGVNLVLDQTSLTFKFDARNEEIRVKLATDTLNINTAKEDITFNNVSNGSLSYNVDALTAIFKKSTNDAANLNDVSYHSNIYNFNSSTNSDLIGILSANTSSSALFFRSDIPDNPDPEEKLKDTIKEELSTHFNEIFIKESVDNIDINDVFDDEAVFNGDNVTKYFIKLNKNSNIIFSDNIDSDNVYIERSEFMNAQNWFTNIQRTNI